MGCSAPSEPPRIHWTAALPNLRRSGLQKPADDSVHALHHAVGFRPHRAVPARAVSERSMLTLPFPAPSPPAGRSGPLVQPAPSSHLQTPDTMRRSAVERVPAGGSSVQTCTCKPWRPAILRRRISGIDPARRSSILLVRCATGAADCPEPAVLACALDLPAGDGDRACATACHQQPLRDFVYVSARSRMTPAASCSSLSSRTGRAGDKIENPGGVARRQDR